MRNNDFSTLFDYYLGLLLYGRRFQKKESRAFPSLAEHSAQELDNPKLQFANIIIKWFFLLHHHLTDIQWRISCAEWEIWFFLYFSRLLFNNNNSHRVEKEKRTRKMKISARFVRNKNHERYTIILNCMKILQSRQSRKTLARH